ncbi:prephenate dehydratase [Shewanella dokdonensis]|uniref:Prephenate dehydratase n=1 Tax=Shewanella dokdonensis TaxID=712036 RepID=A0ABX8DD56_9GAMM|nr:prephenate dehydratase [Shewanella dokdonensis]MCL1073623.1 prephenate dehydratase [Shewanella dokdonensis]QVK22631.1 prephenate dehydratase [Shewanella dokdonensis]
MKKAPQLNQIREQITSVDKSLLELLSKRRQLSLEVARSKEIDVRPIRDTQREKELLSRLVKQGREQGLDAHYVLSLYQTIIEDSVLNQQAYLQLRADQAGRKPNYTIAYLGARGSYSYLAAHRYCERREMEMQDMGCHSFDEIAKAVESGHADYGFLPIENTSSGSINEVYDLLQHTNLSIVGETTIDVSHCLLVKPGTSAEQITAIYAHPQPISQCSRYLARHPQVKLHYCASSAEAMELVSRGNNTMAAIGSAEGGTLYQLEPLEQDLANQKINQSRFIVVARKTVVVPEQLPAKTTLIMATAQKPGALVEALLVLKAHNLNMSKLESRPIPGTPWEEMFYLDIDGNVSHEDVQQALQQLERITRFIKVLGCYASENVKPTRLENSQLMIEPNSSRQALVNDCDQARYSREFKTSVTEVLSGELHLGNGSLTAITAINAETLLPNPGQHAHALREAGFQAVLINCLEPLATDELMQLKQQLNNAGLQCIFSIQQPADLTILPAYADLLLLSGKQMFNKELLTKMGALNIPIILERNTMASEQDWLNAADLLLAGGNQQLVLCEAGVRSFSHPEELTLDLAALVNIKARSHLPIMVNLCNIDVQQQAQLACAANQLHTDGLVLPAADLTAQRQQLAQLYQQRCQ